MGCSFSSPYISEGAISYGFSGPLATQASFGVAGTLLGSSVPNNTQGCAAYATIKPTAIFANTTYSCSDMPVPTGNSSSVELLCDLPQTKLTSGLLTVNYHAGNYGALLQQQIFTVTSVNSNATGSPSATITPAPTSNFSISSVSAGATVTPIFSGNSSLASGASGANTRGSASSSGQINLGSSSILPSSTSNFTRLTGPGSNPSSSSFSSGSSSLRTGSSGSASGSNLLSTVGSAGSAGSAGSTGSAGAAGAATALSSAAGSSPSQVSSSNVPLITSTVFSTTVYTITSCAATVTDCPARSGNVVVVTDVVPLYVTVCPATAAAAQTAEATSVAGSNPVVTRSASALATYTASSAPTQAAGDSTGQGLTTLTVYSTTVYTVTSCAPTVTNCPAKATGPVTVNELVPVYVTVCPVAALQGHSTQTAVAPLSTKSALPNTGAEAQTNGNGASLEQSTANTVTVTTTTYLPFSACSNLCLGQSARPVLKARQAAAYSFTTTSQDKYGKWSTKTYAGPEYTFSGSANPSAYSTVSSSASVKSTSASSSVTPLTTASATGSVCAASPTATLLPVANADIDLSDLSNLNPSYNATLNYAQASPGVSAASIKFEMRYPQVTLEDSSFIGDVTCAYGDLNIELTEDGGAFDVISQWPQSGLVLITDSSTCNNATERGVYMVTSYLSSLSALQFTFSVIKTSWEDVASAMEITYGTIGDTSAAATPSQCSASYTPTTTFTPQPTSTSDSISFDDLSPAAQDVVNYIASKIHYNADGSIQLYTKNATNATEIPAATWQPNNATLQAALEAALDNAGLDTPAAIIQKAKNALAHICTAQTSASTASSSAATSSNTAIAKRSLTPHSRRDTFDDYACSDLAEAFLGDYDDAVCGAKDLIQNGASIKCLFTSCETTTTVTTHVYTYTFSQDWKATFGLKSNSAVVTFGDGSVLSCINCGLSLASFKIAGTVRYVYETKALQAATLTISEDSTTNMIYELNAKGPVAYNWTTALNSGNLDTISVGGVFSITPSVIFSMGVEFSTDAAVDVQGGAVLSVSSAHVDIDMSTLATTNIGGWAPSVDMTNPTFTTAAKVELIPYIRRLITISFNVLDQASNSITFATSSGLGFDSEMIEKTGGACAVDQLALTSYISNTNLVVYGQNVYTTPLNQLVTTNPVKCFNVPSNKPTLDEIQSLSAVGQDFCTAYNNYIPPTSGLYLVRTVTGPSPTTTTQVITVTSIPTTTVTTETTATLTRVIDTTAYVTTSGSSTEQLATAYLMKRDAAQVTTTPTLKPRIAERQITYPSIVSGWPASKISYACSQVATGTVTRTLYTATSTAYSGVWTSTVTSFTNTEAQASTKTSTLTDYVWTTTTSIASQNTIPASCPLQTQVTCFTITGHGSAQIEGKQLGVKEGVLNPSFEYSPSTFYLDCDGALVSLPDLRVLSGPGGANKCSFSSDWTSPASCTRDSVTKELSCFQDGSNIMYVWQPESESSMYWAESYFRVVPREDASLWVPAWGAQGNASEYQAITLTTEEVSCPCADPVLDQTTLVSVDTATPVCPASDGTIYATSDGSEWQIQCSTNYADTTTSTVTAASLVACIAACDAVGSCVGAAWTASSQQCALKGSMLSDTYTTGDSVHAVVRLATLPGVSNLITNGNFTGGSYWVDPAGWTKGGWMDVVDCTSEYAYFEDEEDCEYNMPYQSYAYSLQSSCCRYSAYSQTVALVPGYEYRLSLNAGYLNNDQNCLVSYSLDDDVFENFYPVNTGSAPEYASGWRHEGPYSVIAAQASQSLTISMACPDAIDNDGWAWWTNVTFYGPYSV